MPEGAHHRPTRSWITPDEAAAILGVKRETVYAYVSRGRLTSRRADQGNGTVLDGDEVARLADRGKTTRRVSQDGNQSSICLVQGGRPYYRGRDVEKLAMERSIEEVAALLWDVAAEPWEAVPETVDQCRRVVAGMPSHTLPIDLLRMHEASIAAFDPPEPDPSPEVFAARARRVLASMIAAMPETSDVFGGSGISPIAALLWSRLSSVEATPTRVAMLNAALVMLADHDLARSTVAVRCAARTGVDVGCIIRLGLDAGAGIVKGAAALAIESFLRGLGSGESVEGALTQRVRRGEPIPGFGHAVYPDGDPRARVILDLLRSEPVDPERMATVARILEVQARKGLPGPNAGFALAALSYTTHMIPGAGEAIFVVARSVGLVAHALEVGVDSLAHRRHSTYVGLPPER